MKRLWLGMRLLFSGLDPESVCEVHSPRMGRQLLLIAFVPLQRGRRESLGDPKGRTLGQAGSSGPWPGDQSFGKVGATLVLISGSHPHVVVCRGLTHGTVLTKDPPPCCLGDTDWGI